MRIRFPFKFIVVVIILGFMVPGCSAAHSGDVSIWVDAPRPGGRVYVGEVVYIQTHAYAKAGVAQVELKVDGVDISREAPSPAGADLVTLTQTWQASAPGFHTLQVAAYASDGTVSGVQVVSIEVLAPGTPSIQQPPLAAEHQVITTTPAPPITLTPTTTATLGVITPTNTPLPILPPTIIFNADDASILAGECTFLRWQVQNAESVTFDGASVGNPDARQVCPMQTTNYTLRAVSAGGERIQTLQVQVSIPAPQDTSGPVFSNLSASLGEIFDNASCGADRTQVTAIVTDSGSGVKRVDIYFQAVRSASAGKNVLYGQQISLRMNGTESQGYSIILSPAELAQSMALYGGTTIRYYLVAIDNAGNTSQSGTASFIAKTCIF